MPYNEKNNKLIITRQNNCIITSLFSDNEMIQVNVDKEEHSILGNIYLGKVKNIVKNINAAFVEISEKQMCYLALSELRNPVFADGHVSDTVKIGDELFVQVSKEDVKTKAPVVITCFNLTGKYLVLVHGKPMIGVSAKIDKESRKKQLKKIISDYVTENYGFIVRTNAAFASEQVILSEICQLIALYQNLNQYGIHRTCFSLLHETPPAYLCEIRDGFSEDLYEILTEDKSLYLQIETYLKNFQKEDIGKLRLHTDDSISLERIYGINQKLLEAKKEKVWLKSGGNLIIQPTEALTVIDINSGKAIYGKREMQETFFKVNKEAAKEIAKQIRLRNLSGIIIIDFINMESVENKQKLMELLKEYVKTDPVKTTVVDMTALNLVEITRKKVRKPLYEQLIW